MPSRLTRTYSLKSTYFLQESSVTSGHRARSGCENKDHTGIDPEHEAMMSSTTPQVRKSFDTQDYRWVSIDCIHVEPMFTISVRSGGCD